MPLTSNMERNGVVDNGADVYEDGLEKARESGDASDKTFHQVLAQRAEMDLHDKPKWVKEM